MPVRAVQIRGMQNETTRIETMQIEAMRIKAMRIEAMRIKTMWPRAMEMRRWAEENLTDRWSRRREEEPGMAGRGKPRIRCRRFFLWPMTGVQQAGRLR